MDKEKREKNDTRETEVGTLPFIISNQRLKIETFLARYKERRRERGERGEILEKREQRKLKESG